MNIENSHAEGISGTIESIMDERFTNDQIIAF